MYKNLKYIISLPRQLLSEMLTGQAKPLQDLPREFELLAARGSVDEHLQAASGLDLVVYFSASTEVVLQRASQQGVCVQCS